MSSNLWYLQTIFPGCLSVFSSGQNYPQDVGKVGPTILIEDDAPLAKLYNKILLFLAGDPKLIMDIAEQVTTSSARDVRLQASDHIDESLEDNKFDFLANVLWAEVSRAVTDELGAVVFAVGKPDDFHKVCCH